MNQAREASLNKYSVHDADKKRSEEDRPDAADWTAVPHVHILPRQWHYNAIN